MGQTSDSNAKRARRQPAGHGRVAHLLLRARSTCCRRTNVAHQRTIRLSRCTLNTKIIFNHNQMFPSNSQYIHTEIARK
jgi:hypothetical protein